MSLTDRQLRFLDGLLEAFDEFPGGAWQVACEDAIAECGEFAGRDPNDVWLEWAIARSGLA